MVADEAKKLSFRPVLPTATRCAPGLITRRHAYYSYRKLSNEIRVDHRYPHLVTLYAAADFFRAYVCVLACLLRLCSTTRSYHRFLLDDLDIWAKTYSHVPHLCHIAHVAGRDASKIHDLTHIFPALDLYLLTGPAQNIWSITIY